MRERYDFVVVGYVVMPEYVHLLINQPERGTQSTVMQVLKQRFARRVLKELRKRQRPGHGRSYEEALDRGHLWQARFYDFVVRSEIKKREKLQIFMATVRRGLVLEPERCRGAVSGRMPTESAGQCW